ncbi:MAG: hypothetical protein RR595_06330 [Lysinibacillus sp.]
MFLRCDELLLTAYNNEGESSAEQLLQQWADDHTNAEDYTHIFGQTLAPDIFLVNEEMATNLVFSTARKYWVRAEENLQTKMVEMGFDIAYINSRLDDFFYSPQGKEAMFEHLVIHHTFDSSSLIALVFGKRFESPIQEEKLKSIHMCKVEDRYLVHIIYEENERFWHWLFAKKIYSLLIHKSIEKISFIRELMTHLESSWREAYPHVNKLGVDFKDFLDKCITHVDKHNATCLTKKQLRLHQIVVHYREAKEDFTLVRHLVATFESEWRYSMYAQTEKEQVLIAYILLDIAAKEGCIAETIQYGEFLLQDERLNNYAVEIMLEYYDVLPNVKPTPKLLIKHYGKNYLEYLYAELLSNYVKAGQYEQGLQLLRTHELASSESIFEVITTEKAKDEQFIAIEAAVQRDIAMLVDNSLTHVGVSTEEWRANYKDAQVDYFKIAKNTSLHVMDILKILFVTEQFELFEKLMDIYKKYLLVDEHFEEMREFMRAYV